MSISVPGPDRKVSNVKVSKTTGEGDPPPPDPTSADSSSAVDSSAVDSSAVGSSSEAASEATDAPAAPASPAKKAAPAAKKAPAKKATPAKRTTPAKRAPAGKGGGKGRKPITPVKVAGGRNWLPIIVAGVVVLIAAGIIGYGVYAATKSSKQAATPWEERANAISGIVNYRTNSDKTITARNHKPGPLTYKTSPPVGGDHNPRWENCMGDIYDQPIPNEHAVHALEHGAVWVTYKQGLPADQIDKLKAKVQGQAFMLMSPFPNLDKNVSLQAWGYQLKVDTADDTRIDDFIKALRSNATVEPDAVCSNGITAVGSTPQDS